jgi:hypothetical protein
VNPSPAYADARRTAQERSSARLNHHHHQGAASAAPTIPSVSDEDLLDMQESLAEGHFRLPPGVSFCRSINPMARNGRVLVTTLTIPPLGPLSVREAVEIGLLDPIKGFQRMIYDRLVTARSGRSGPWRRLWASE